MKERAVARIEGLIVGHKSDGRCVYSKAGKQALIQACLQPGVSVAASALANGVNANLLRKWILRHARSQRGKAGVAAQPSLTRQAAPVLLPVKLSEATLAARTALSVEPINAKVPPAGNIEIEYAGARIILHGLVSAQQLGVVLACLSRGA